MKRKLIITGTALFLAFFMTACDKIFPRDGQNDLGTGNSEADPPVSNTEQEENVSFTGQLEKQNKEKEEIKNEVLKDIKDANLKREIEAGIDLGRIDKSTIIDVAKDDKTFDCKYMKFKAPDGFKKMNSTGLTEGFEDSNLSDKKATPETYYTIRLAFSRDASESYSIESVKSLYIPTKENTDPNTEVSTLLDTKEKLIIKNVYYMMEDKDKKKPGSVTYLIYDTKSPKQIVRIQFSNWDGPESVNIKTKYDEWVKTVEVK